MVLIVVPDKYNLLYREVPTMQHFLRRVVVYSSLSSVTKLKAKSRKKIPPFLNFEEGDGKCKSTRKLVFFVRTLKIIHDELKIIDDQKVKLEARQAKIFESKNHSESASSHFGFETKTLIDQQ